jgi:vancomycin resistance protein VanJ
VITVAALGSWGLLGDTALTAWINLVAFWWLLPAIPLAAAAALAGERRGAAVLLVPALAWLWAYGGLLLPASGEPGPTDVRVLSFNLYVHTPDLDHVVALVERHDPEVVLLQELFPPAEEELDRRLGERYPHRHVEQSPGVGGVAVLSEHPITEVAPVRDAATHSRATGVVTLDVDGRPLQVVSVHLTSPCPRCGPTLRDRLRVEVDARRAEVEAVLAALDEDVPAVVGGDLNTSERSDPYRRLVAAGFEDPQRAVGRGMGFTAPDDWALPPFVRFDWVLTRGVAATEAHVGDGGPSDHRPVIVGVAFKEE